LNSPLIALFDASSCADIFSIFLEWSATVSWAAMRKSESRGTNTSELSTLPFSSLRNLLAHLRLN
jgi:hypothetical protein